MMLLSFLDSFYHIIIRAAIISGSRLPFLCLESNWLGNDFDGFAGLDDDVQTLFVCKFDNIVWNDRSGNCAKNTPLLATIESSVPVFSENVQEHFRKLMDSSAGTSYCSFISNGSHYTTKLFRNPLAINQKRVTLSPQSKVSSGTGSDGLFRFFLGVPLPSFYDGILLRDSVK